MTDSMHQPRDENGQWVSIATLFERERQEHARDHERETRDDRELARFHSESHQKEHAAHERIHSVEKDQQEKAATAQKEAATVLSNALATYKADSNEWRATVADQAARGVTRELFDTKFESFAKDMQKIEKRMAYYSGFAAAAGFMAALVFRLLTV